MKNLKSLLAIVMVLVIGACLTGCVSKAEKQAANEEFAKWFGTVSIVPGETSGVTLNLRATSYYVEHGESFTPVLLIGEVEYEPDRYSFDRESIYVDDEKIVILDLHIDFDDVETTDYDVLKMTIKYDDGEEIAVTYYPDV
jgi:hypothetical protein